MRIGSLFSGAGGLDLAVEAVTGGRTVWQSDVCKVNKDGTVGHYTPCKAPCSVLAHRFPGVPNHGDVAAIDWAAVEPIDVLAAGFPCQDVSAAGKRAGLKPGTRTGLWSHVAYAISQLQPRLVVLENVRGLLSARAHSDVEPCTWCVGDNTDGALRALGAVLGDLAGLGYDARWYGLRAADVGACHGRFRVFIVAYPAGDPWRLELEHGDGGVAADADSFGGQRVGGARQWGNGSANGLLPTSRATDGTHGGPNQRGSSGDLMLPSAVALLPTPAVNDMGDNKTLEWWDEWTAKQKAATGNGNGHGKSLAIEAQRLLPTPSVADVEGGRKTRSGARGGELLLNGLAPLLPTPRTANNENRQSEGYQGDTGNFHGLLKGSASWGDYAVAIARHEQALGRPAPAPTQLSAKGPPQLSPAFVEWMMMWPAGWVTDVPGVTRNQALKACGNGVVPAQAVAALRLLLAEVTP